MIKLFSSNQSYVLILIPVFALFHLLLDFYFPQFGTLSSGQDNLWGFDFNAIDLITSKFLAFVFICANSILLNFAFNSLEFYRRFVYLPSILYTLLIFLFPVSVQFGEIFLAHFFFIFSFYQLLSVRHNNDARNNALLSGLFLGVATTFSPIYICFLPIIWMGIFIIRPFVFREHLISIAGFSLPFLWLFLVNPNFINSFTSFERILNYGKVNKYARLFLFIILISMIVLSYVKIIRERSMSSVRFKMISLITISALSYAIILGVLFYMVKGTYSYFAISISIFPLILPYIFLKVKNKWLPNSLLYGLLLFNIIKFFYLYHNAN